MTDRRNLRNLYSYLFSFPLVVFFLAVPEVPWPPDVCQALHNQSSRFHNQNQHDKHDGQW